MRTISFSVVKILPHLLDKSKDQTIRPAWKEVIAEFPKYKCCADAGCCDCERETELVSKSPYLKVKEEVKLYWKQRTKFKWFCRDCGNGIDGYVTKYLGIDVFRTNRLHECIKRNQVKNFLDLVFKDNSVFSKILGTVIITEVFKIEMNRRKESTIPQDKYELYWMDGDIKCKWPWGDIEDLAKRDGFDSAEEMFKVFDDMYDLSVPKKFYVYRWRWNK